MRFVCSFIFSLVLLLWDRSMRFQLNDGAPHILFYSCFLLAPLFYFVPCAFNHLFFFLYYPTHGDCISPRRHCLVRKYDW